MKQKISSLFLLCTLWLVSAVPAPATVPNGLTAADWQAIQSLVPGSYFKASNTNANDQFGFVVAVDGDTMVVGAYREDSNAIGVDGDQTNNAAVDSGAAYVFIRTDGVWSQQAYLKASNTNAGDWFGYTVDVSGDTIVVGALLEDSNALGVNGNQTNNTAVDSGAAYVFTRTDGVWSQQAYLKASNTEAADTFGQNVAIADDAIIVGAHGEASNATGVNGNQSNNLAANSGAAYIFTRTSGVWSQQAYLKASNTGSGDRFGIAVDIDQDTAIVSAYWEASNATGVNGDQTNNDAFQAGAAYVFVRTGGVWSQQAYLKASNTGAGDYFGSVTISGDTIVVGAPREDSNAIGINGDQNNDDAPNSGAAYIFTRTGGVWSQQAYLKASNTGANDWFGTTTISGDTIVVGAYQEDSNAIGVNGNQQDESAVDAGAVYVFTRTGGVWSQHAYLKASNTEGGDNLGWDVATADGTIVVSGHAEDSSATGVNNDQSNNDAINSGAVYTFEPPIYPLQIILAGTGAGQAGSIPEGISCGITCTAYLTSGTVVTLTATADVGSTFTGWSGDLITTTNPINFSMDMTRTITATFALNQYELNVATVGNGTAAPNSGTYEYGTVVTLTATADIGSTFMDWSGDVVSTTNPITVTMDSDKFITATFTLNQYELNVATVGSGTAVPSNGTYDYGTVVTVTATADLGSTFTDWSGDVVTTTNPITVTINSDKFITATFTLNQYELDVATVGNGTAAPNSGTYDYGTVVTLTATADTGSTFLDWSGDIVTTTNPITLTIDSDKSITATFALNQYELTLITTGSGSGTVGSNPVGALFDYGTVVTLTATADVGSAFTGWSGSITSTDPVIMVTMDEAKSITATFALDAPPIYRVFLPLVMAP